MSAELHHVGGPGGNQKSSQGTTVGGSKPLHRFLKGQPKIIGIIVLVMGTALLIVSAAAMVDFFTLRIWSVIPPGLMLGALFIISGILYILTEHKPTKKTVTISLALSILTILWVGWTNLRILPHIGHYYFFMRYEVDYDENTTVFESSRPSHFEGMATALEAIMVFYSLVGGIIFIVMSVLAAAAVRSTKSQAIVVMTATASETPVE